MKHLIRMGFLAALVASSAAVVYAQTSRMYPWWDGPIAKDLGLTEEQITQIRATVRESRSAMTQLRAAVDTAETDLKNAMNSDPVDARKANETIDKVVNARADLLRAVSQMSLKLRLTLTAAQWQELQKRQPQRAIPLMQRGGARRANRAAPDPPMDHQ